MSRNTFLISAAAFWFLADLTHAVWHAASLDDTSFLVSVPPTDIAFLAVLALAYWWPRSQRFGGGTIAVAAGLWSIARGVSGIAAGEGFGTHGLLVVSGVPILLAGLALLANRERVATPRVRAR